ncbi:hypothetical protein [Amycolatopsis sp. NBC_00345]|uniref:hypothetical protein n=1 Tax=Amycolatopsis sp. NBC_00345 TaxID=2975955 RepID=UPI002E273CAE
MKNAAVVQPQAKAGGAAGSSAGGSAGDVNCSTNGGQVGPAGGPMVDLIAVSTEEGTPGCTEAFNVISEYYAKAPNGEGPGRRVLDIAGHWDCAKAAEPEGSQGVVLCGKDGGTGFRIETAPSKDSAPSNQVTQRFPNTTQTVQFTGYDTTANMARFQLVTWQAGGPDNGHYVPVAGDTKTYRLPLENHEQVFSASTVCPGDSVTVDGQGRGTKACTPQDLMQALTGDTPPLAEIQVDGNDHIAVVKELYQP